MKKLLCLLTVCMLIVPMICPALTPTEVYNDGLRAFNNARWIEAEEIFRNFMETWPEHKLQSDALYYASISKARSFKGLCERAVSENLLDLQEKIRLLEKAKPDADLSELKVAVSIARNCQKAVIWKELSALPAKELKHYLSRGWYPAPAADPVQALAWVKTWKDNNKPPYEPDLHSRLYLIEAQSMWQLLLSPVAAAANAKKLEELSYMPLLSSLEKALNDGFEISGPELKRELAMIGCHYEMLKKNGLTDSAADISNRWYTYLVERGLNLQETLCPR